MRFKLMLFGIFAFVYQANCQLNDSFSDGDLTNNPTWVDVAGHFKVNEAFQLQLDSPEAGNSFIYTAIDLVDSIRWSSYCLMDFAPSGSNQLRVILAADDFSPEASNSLYFEVGESGSNDALTLIEVRDGIATTIGSASMGALGAEPAEFSFILEKTSDNNWSLFVNYDQTISQPEWEMNLSIPWIQNSVMFGYSMKYTDSRKDKFFFDDIKVEPLLPDTDPPSLIGGELISSSEIRLSFSEAMDPAVLAEVSNYSISPSISGPSMIEVDPDNSYECIVRYNEPLKSGTIYQLSVSGLVDIAGNLIPDSTIELALREPAVLGDILINEILFNPNTGGTDFIEIYNHSNKFIDLNSLTIANVDKNSFIPLNATDALFPGEYLVICDDLDWLAENYELADEDATLENSLPAFNDDEGNVSVFSLQADGSSELIDAVDYSDDWHFQLLLDDEGISLERIVFDAASNDQNNWNSASEASGYATPGYKNSQEAVIEGSNESISLVNKVFSPNQDGDQDQLIFKYDLPKEGFLVTIKVFNDRGILVRELIDNNLVSSTGIITWDGTKNNSQRASVGIYLIAYEFFHSDGDIIAGKHSCVLADFLK